MRMLKVKYILQILFLFLILCCSKDEVENTGRPGVPNLVFPENNTPCLDTTVVNDNQSSVTFRWSLTRDTNSYRLFVTNLSTDQLQQFSSDNPEVTATLNHGEPYSWKVRAYGPKGTAPSESETWKFYLSGNGISNYPPYPSTLISPSSGHVFPSSTTSVELSWEGSHPENSSLNYDLYIDTTDGLQEPISSNKNLSAKSKSLQVSSGKSYYWRVKATDSNNNSSYSIVFSFRVD